MRNRRVQCCQASYPDSAPFPGILGQHLVDDLFHQVSYVAARVRHGPAPAEPRQSLRAPLELVEALPRILNGDIAEPGVLGIAGVDA